jgi:DNA-binding response OmpR family regulator
MSDYRILYVEDEALLGKIVKESLESRGLQIDWYQEGEPALGAANRVPYDLAVLDVMLPGEDGFTIGKKLRSAHPGLPIIFLTAKSQAKDVLTGFQSGGNDYLRKPFSMEELLVRIDNLIQLTRGRAAPSPSENRIDFGRFQFYPDRLELHLDDAPYQTLSHREGELLQLFVSALGQTIERRQILKSIWGDDGFFNSRNLDVYVRKLRGYLAADDTVRIITLRGVGYRVVVAD